MDTLLKDENEKAQPQRVVGPRIVGSVERTSLWSPAACTPNAPSTPWRGDTCEEFGNTSRADSPLEPRTDERGEQKAPRASKSAEGCVRRFSSLCGAAAPGGSKWP